MAVASSGEEVDGDPYARVRVNLDVGEELGLPGAQLKDALDELGRQVVADRVGEQPQLGVL
jgi:hypothetical protein